MVNLPIVLDKLSVESFSIRVPLLLLGVDGDRSNRVILHGFVTADAVTFKPAEERQETVVVLLRNRVDFVIVAAGTIHGQPKKDLRRRQQYVVQIIVQCLFLADWFIVPDAEPVVAGSND